MNVLLKIVATCELANGKLNVSQTGSTNATMTLRGDLRAKLCFCRWNGDPMDEELVDQLPSPQKFFVRNLKSPDIECKKSNRPPYLAIW
jgi:hypothetical protein